MRSIAGLLVPPQPEMKTKKEVPSASVWKLERREKCRYKGGSEVGSLGSGWGWGVGDGWYLHSQHLLGRKQSEQGHPRLHINFKASLGFLGLSQKSNRERQPGVVAHTVNPSTWEAEFQASQDYRDPLSRKHDNKEGRSLSQQVKVLSAMRDDLNLVPESTW